MKIRIYRKLIAAVVGVIAIKFGPEVLPNQAALVEAIMMALTAFGVWAVPNDTE